MENQPIPINPQNPVSGNLTGTFAGFIAIMVAGYIANAGLFVALSHYISQDPNICAQLENGLFVFVIFMNALTRQTHVSKKGSKAFKATSRKYSAPAPGGNVELHGKSRCLAVAVTASPMTYTAGTSPETLYVRGGTVESILVNSATVAESSPATIELPPNVAAIINFSATPSLTKYAH